MDIQQQPPPPPWADELRNRKVGRNIWSTSDSIYDGKTSSFTFEFEKGQNYYLEGNNDGVSTRKRTGDREQKVIDPVSTSRNPTSPGPRTGNIVHDAGGDLRLGGLTTEGEAMRENLRYNTSGEESLIQFQYGPGIVSKLRSKYQSLSARLQSSRPVLRRSSSLEHSLDFIQSESRIQSQSPVPSKSTSAYRGGMTLNIRPVYENCVVKPPTNSSVAQENNNNNSGGRTNEQVNRQNRMRRARSVDALHHVGFTPQEEEILEKFKNVVLPKEEVVIIEMSKPRLYIGSLGDSNFSSANEKQLGSSGGLPHHHFTHISSLISPEHELPPQDIVRETARIFETNPGNHRTQWRKVGHALRVCKSSSVSPSSSACSSPIPSSTTPSPVGSAEKKIQVVSAQPQAYNSQKEDLNANVRNMNNLHNNNKSARKAMSHGHNGNNSNSNTMGSGVNAHLPSPTRQIGIIRPTTVNGVPSATTMSSVTCPPVPARQNLPPIKTNKAFQFITPNKPPLSPKPILPERKGIGNISKNSNKETERTKEEVKVTNAKVSTGQLSGTSDQEMKSKVNNSSSALDNSVIKSTNSNPSSDTTSPSDVSLDSYQDSYNAIPSVTTPNQVKFSTTDKTNESFQKQGKDMKVDPIPVSSSNQSQNSSNRQPYNDIINTTISKQPTVKGKEREGDALKNKLLVPEEKEKKTEPKSVPVVSQLRSHQKQKSQQSNAGGSMVFNFTSRNKVPDYIEDDGLHRMNLNGMDEAGEDVADGMTDPKLINFIGANVIINGKSSIQKKPKLKKMNIRFNEEGTTTFEYPSEEASALLEDVGGNIGGNNLVGVKSSTTAINLSGGGALSSYTPSKLVPNSYQLGSYRESGNDSNLKRSVVNKKEVNGESIEEYLKPDSGTTNWSSELGAADILF